MPIAFEFSIPTPNAPIINKGPELFEKQIIHLLFLIVEKLVLKSFKKSAIHTQLDKPNIHIEPIACIHKAPALV